MDKLVKIVNSRFEPPLKAVGDIVIQVSAPYSATSVTVHVNPFVTDYQKDADTAGAQVQQVMVTKRTDQTRVLFFDLGGKKTHTFNIEGRDYDLELVSIGDENVQGQDFPCYEFRVTKG